MPADTAAKRIRLERERDSLARIEGAARPELPAAVAPATTAPEEKRREAPRRREQREEDEFFD